MHLYTFYFALLASYFSLHAQRKVTKRKGIPGARASHALSQLDGSGSFPVKFAEPFDFGRENPTGMLDLALSSLDGESRRPVGKVEW